MQYKTRGVVLISVLLIVLLLSSIAALIGNNHFTAFKRAQFIEFQTISLNIFKSIESLALKKIDNELRFNSKIHSKNNPLFVDNFLFETDKGIVKGKLIDSSNCFNMNSIVTRVSGRYKPNKQNIDVFKRLLIFKDVDRSIIEEVVDQIIDWIDSDSEPRAYGLEDYYYTGPLSNPKEYTGSRIFFSLSELKSLPAIRQIGWHVFSENFCVFPNNALNLNINTINDNDIALIASIFEDITYSDAEYIIDNIPENGIKNFKDLKNLFPLYNIESSKNYVKFSSTNFNLVLSLSYENFISDSISKIYYGNNNNSYIISRIYNGI